MLYNPLRRISRYAHTRNLFSTLVVISITLVMALAACGGSSSNPQSKSGGKISVGLDSDVVRLDPLKSTALVDRQVMLNIYDTLVKVNQQNVLVPDLATTWSYTSPTQLVFTLRTDVKF